MHVTSFYHDAGYPQPQQPTMIQQSYPAAPYSYPQQSYPAAAPGSYPQQSYPGMSSG